MAEHLLKNAHQLQEYAIETETVPELDSLPDQPATQVNYIITRDLSPLSDKHRSQIASFSIAIECLSVVFLSLFC